MNVISNGNIPVYETECSECGAKFTFIRSDVFESTYYPSTVRCANCCFKNELNSKWMEKRFDVKGGGML